MSKHSKLAFGLFEDGHTIRLVQLLRDKGQFLLQGIDRVELDQALYHAQEMPAALQEYEKTSWEDSSGSSDKLKLDELEEEVLLELMTLAKQASEVLEDVYKPQGFNLGMNVGKVAGAGIAEHLHLHIVPRWNGDANFISVVGQTRVLPDGLEESHQRLSEAWKRLFPEE